MEDERLIAAVQARSAIYDKWDKNHHNRQFIARAWDSIAADVGSDAVSCRNRWGTIRDYFVRKHRQAATRKDGGQAAPRKIKWHLYEHLAFLIPIYCQKEAATYFDGEDFADVNGDFQEDNGGDTSLAAGGVVMADVEEATCDAQSPTASISSEDFLENTSVTFKMPTAKRKRKSENAISFSSSSNLGGSSELDRSLQLVKAIKDSETVDENELFFRSLLPSLSRLDHVQTMEFRLEVQSVLLRYLKANPKEHHRSSHPPTHPTPQSTYEGVGFPHDDNVYDEHKHDSYPSFGKIDMHGSDQAPT